MALAKTDKAVFLSYDYLSQCLDGDNQ